MAFIKQDYFRLEIVEKQWNLSHDEVMYAVENDMLKVCVWLPMCFVEFGKSGVKEFYVLSRDHCEGLVRVRPKDCHMLFQRGEVMLDHFLPTKGKRHKDIRIALEPKQPSLKVCVRDLLVTNDHRVEFEQAYNVTVEEHLPLFEEEEQRHASIRKRTNGSRYLKQKNHYRHVMIPDKDFHLGPIQAKIVEQLHIAHQDGNQWIYGKVLLSEVGSQCHRMRDVFKSQPYWRELIESDGRGHYRLRAA